MMPYLTYLKLMDLNKTDTAQVIFLRDYRRSTKNWFLDLMYAG